MPTIATLGAASARAFGLFGSTAGTDPYFFYNTLLLPGNGTNGAQNNTFLDSSTNNFTITRNGNTTQGTFTPYGSNWSNYFDGNNTYLSIANTTALQFGTGDFTIESFVFLTATPSAQFAQIIGRTVYGSNADWMLQITNANKLTFYMQGSFIVTSTGNVPLNTWTHVAVSRSGSTVRLFINGTVDGTATNSGSTENTSSGNYTIGAAQAGTNVLLTGYLSNLRTNKGTAVYTSNFTPSTTPLTAISGTSLLTCQSNRFIDNSSNAFAITVNGSPSVQRFSPFNPSAPYAAGTIGGSGYFDGTGDSLSLASGSTALPTGTQDFCVEMWLYWQTQGGSYPQIISNPTTNGFQIYYDVASGLLAVGIFNVSNIITYTIAQTALSGAWTHLAVTRSGNTFRMFVNGVLRANGTNTISFASLTTQYIGSDGSRPYTGYMSDVRTVLGSIPTSYQTSSTTNGTSIFTPTSAPLTTSSQGATSGDVELLCLFTNGGIIDNAMMNDLETVGNAQISTTQSKFGGSSMYFDGTGDYLVAPSNSIFSFGTGDFTIECWYYSGATGQQTVFDTRNTSSGPGVLVYTLSNKLRVYSNGVDYIGTANVASNTWVHLVVERRSSALYTYVNGTVDINGTSYTPNLTDSSCIVGYDIRYGGFYLNGYIDDLRITKGYARYTSNFTPPTAAFPLS